jgi:hypothetical protein
VDWQYALDDEDKGWDWLSLYIESLQLPGRFERYSTFALRDVQGLMRLDLGATNDPQARPVIVDYLATNPLNRRRSSGLKYIGVTLIAVAVMRSVALAEAFYSSLGMRKLRRRSPDDYSISR